MNNSLFDFAILSFVSLFTVINPIGVAPIYISMTGGLDKQQARKVALRASLTALIVLTAFGLTGQWIMDFFSISVDSYGLLVG